MSSSCRFNVRAAGGESIVVVVVEGEAEPTARLPGRVLPSGLKVLKKQLKGQTAKVENDIHFN
jgi:hypothetical protein